MSSNQVAQALAVIKATAGRIAKKDLLVALREAHPEMSAAIMKAVFDKDVTYGMAKPPASRLVGRRPREFNATTWGLLSDLAERKLTGTAAKEAVACHLGTLSGPSRDLLVMILQQNLRAGFGIDVVVEVFGPIVETFDICLAQEWDKEKHKIAASEAEYNPKKHIGYYPIWLDVKYDGLRGFRFHKDPTLYSRKKIPLACPPELMQLMTEFLDEVADHSGIALTSGLFLDCEIVSVDGIFRDAVSSATSRKKGATEGSLMIRIIDLLTEAELAQGKSEEEQATRRQGIEEMLKLPEFERFFPLIQLTEGEEVQDEAGADAFFKKCLARELEGFIAKILNGHWEGKRSYSWLKRKAKASIKGRIIGYEMADPLSKNVGKIGAIKYELPSGARGKVSGMTDKMRDDVTANQDHYMDEQIEMLYHELTPDGVLRHPRVKAIRSDRE